MAKKSNDDKIKEFGDLLDTLSNTEDKKKLLWKEAYQNAIDDRLTTSILVNDLIVSIPGSSANHATHGILMTKYLERMSKCNDQILKLAELVAKEQAREDNIPIDDIFKQMGQ